MLAGSYVVTAQVPHRYQFGMSYSLQRYEGGNTAALTAVSDTARNVGSVFAYDEWAVSRYVAVGYGATYAHYDYLQAARRCSARAVSATFSPTENVARARLGVARGQRAGRRGIPAADARRVPAAAAHVLAALARRASARRSCRTTKCGVERVLNGATIGVRAFDQRIDDQTVTVFGLRQTTARPPRSATTTSARPATPTSAASASRSRTRCSRTSAARSTIRWPTPNWIDRADAGRVRGADAMGARRRCAPSTSAFTT